MLSSMQQLALAHLYCQAEPGGIAPGQGLSFSEFSNKYPELVSRLLVESPGKVNQVYILSPDDKDPSLVRLELLDLTTSNIVKFPFVQSPGSQSANYGPVIKRTPPSKQKEPGPSSKILATTLKHFKNISEAGLAWSDYFSDISDVLNRTYLAATDGQIYAMEHGELLSKTVAVIPEKKNTVYLAVRDSSGRLPGEVPEYAQYLSTVLSDDKYQTKAAPKSPVRMQCPLCGDDDYIFPNALSGAGINLGNADRAGAFPGLETNKAYNSFGLCINCAQSLFIFKNYVMSDFITRIAGDKAMVIPEVVGRGRLSGDFLHEFRQWLKYGEQGKSSREKDLLEYFADDKYSNLVLHIIWAKFGNKIEDVSGRIDDVLPSRLQFLRQSFQMANTKSHVLFPENRVSACLFGLNMGFIRELLRHNAKTPKARKANKSSRLSALMRYLAAALYHGRCLSGNEEGLLFQAILDAGLAFLDDVDEHGHWGLSNEGIAKKSGEPYLTFAGWTKHIACLVWMLRQQEVLPMTGTYRYRPQYSPLEPYFGDESGIDSDEKAFAFLNGVLLGKVMQIQGARGVNVASNSITWLKRLQLRGSDLPELYLKIREKLLSYNSEASPIKDVIEEVGGLGVKLGDTIKLDRIATCYFLMLGQSVVNRILPSRQKTDTK